MPESNANISLSGSVKLAPDLRDEVSFFLHAYRYFPYEEELAQREIQKVTGAPKINVSSDCINSLTVVNDIELRRLTYVAEVVRRGKRYSTLQHELEESYRKVAGTGKRQATRYSVHGLHEYKGKFNPQLAHFLLNYLGVASKSKILDPFCGSGTTLVEAALQGVRAFGVDMNPLAVFVTNAKLDALATPAAEISADLERTLNRLKRKRSVALGDLDDRLRYLKKWFPEDTLILLEGLHESIKTSARNSASILFALTSDLLRDYSLQEPADMRIRRRICALPTEPFLSTLKAKASAFLRCLEAAQAVTGIVNLGARAIVEDSRVLPSIVKQTGVPSKFDAVITSPPYATALPYIDTQRLSLVWLGLCSVDEIRRMEADAVGSREMNGRNPMWRERMLENLDGLPSRLASFCNDLQKSLNSKDGFRRQAVPVLVYRYYVDMLKVFSGLNRILNKNAQLAFVVGHNHTVLGGARFDIDTPRDLAALAEHAGFKIKEVISLQTYHRYGLHQKNSINKELLTIFQMP